MISIEFNDIDNLFRKEIKLEIPVKKIVEAVKKDVENNLTTVQAYDDSGIAPLKPGYYKQKKEKAGKKIFDGFRKGSDKLINSVKSKMVNRNEGDIFIGNSNNDIMYYLQEGKSPLAGTRKAFGVSDRVLIKTDSILNDTKLS